MLAESGGHTRKLASAGCSGKHPQNCQRDVTRALDLPLELFYVKVPIKCPSDPKKEVEFDCPIVLPYELYAFLALGKWTPPCDRAEIRKYWDHAAAAVARDPSGENRRLPGREKQSNPFCLWGDDARYNRSGQKLVVFTMNSLLHQSSRDWVDFDQIFYTDI
ncbi:unnamed protein product [Symbiodinium sp. CCMP2592]|nr:unnamed protein product [Symbiodinium sp. CCMP2592]